MQIHGRIHSVPEKEKHLLKKPKNILILDSVELVFLKH